MTTHFVRRLAAACALATAVTMLATTTANAEDIGYRDARHDVVELTFDENDPDAVPQQSASDVQTNVDLTRVRFGHGPRNVTIRATFVDLKRTRPIQLSAAVRTNNRRTYSVAVLAGDGVRRGILMAFGPRGRELRCGATKRIDYTADTIAVTLPRTCFDRPRWVRISAATLDFLPPAADNQTRIVADHPFATRLTGRAAFSPRLSRG
ncbi:MAG TPA: hypothetical protein VFG63_10910 [Nocardioidaceae bacterium]|nr:hypothetical protein [Nocardioidaceae bacterium]